ncbi:MAG: Gldg family protein [Thermodesulfobacteriota bacterium]
MEGVKHKAAAKFLALVGLLIMAVGGLYYAVSLLHDKWGLVVVAAGLLLLLAAAVLGRRELSEFFSRRSARLGLGSGAAIVAVLALVIFLGALSGRHHLRWDLSQGRQHTLAPQTVKVLKELKTPVKAYAFFRETQAGRREADDQLAQYAYASRNFTYQFVDPDREPGMAKRFEVRSYGTVVLVAGKKEERVQLPEEQALTNALIRLTRQGVKTVYFLSGHGEPSLDGAGKQDLSQFKKAIAQNNYQVKSLLLATSSQVPPDATLVIIAGPRKPLLDTEKERLSAYLAKGGGLLVLLSPDQDAGLKDWLAQRGVVLAEDLVLDNAATLANMSPMVPVAVQYGFHQITQPLEGVLCFFPEARTVSLVAKLPPGVTGVELVKTSTASWSTDYKAFIKRYEELAQREKQTGQRQSMELKPLAQDKRGPLSLGVVVNLPVPPQKGAAADKPEVKGRLVVYGNTEFVNNSFLDLMGNRDLALNSVSWLAEEEDLVSIRARQRTSQPLMLQPTQAALAFWLPVVVWPLILAVLGAVVVIRRRRPL